MDSKFIQTLVLKLSRIINYRSKILICIEFNHYDILGNASIKFIKEAESVINVYFKFVSENPKDYNKKKEAKKIIFKIMSFIVNLMCKITEILKDDNIKDNNWLFMNGMLKLQTLKEDYIYILRN